MARCLLGFRGEVTEPNDIEPIESLGLTYAQGRGESLAGVFCKGVLLAYPTPGNYSPKSGTVSLWVKPQWNKAEGRKVRYFWAVDEDSGKQNRTVLGYFGDAKEGYVFFGSDGAFDGSFPSAYARVQWSKAKWHRLMACWDAEKNCRALYIDDIQRHAVECSESMPTDQELFYVGSLPCATWWDGVVRGREAEAILDQIEIHPSPIAEDFENACQLVETDRKARIRCEKSRDKHAPRYLQARERLSRSLSLNSVQEKHKEVSWADVSGLASPLSKRVPIQMPFHSEVIFVQPDMSISLGREPESLGLGFALGSPFRFPDPVQVHRKLHQGYLPIVESTWTDDGLTLSQKAFTFFPETDHSIRGENDQVLGVRVTAKSKAEAVLRKSLFVFIGRMNGTQGTNYAPFLATESRWMGEPLDLQIVDGKVLLNNRDFISYRTECPVEVELHPRFPVSTDVCSEKTILTNCLQFTFQLRADQETIVDFLLTGSSEGSFKSLDKITIDTGQQLSIASWNRLLESAMKIDTRIELL